MPDQPPGCPVCFARFDERCLVPPDAVCPQPERPKGPRPAPVRAARDTDRTTSDAPVVLPFCDAWTRVPVTPSGPIDLMDAILREHLGSMVATKVAVDIFLALRRGGHLKEVDHG